MQTQKELKVQIYQRKNKLHIGTLIKDSASDFFGSHFLALQLAKRDISAQYRQSYLGILWMFITPLATAAIWIFLNSSGTVNVADTGIPYPIYAFSGTLIWSILLEAINSPLLSTNEAKSIITKINFPKEALILSGIYKLCFNSSVKIFLLVIFVFVFGIDFHWSLIMFPFILIIAILFSSALGLLITPIGLLYTDISRLITLALSLLMYMTPVVYSIPKEPGILKTLMELNPFTPLVTTARAMAVGQHPEFLNYFMFLALMGLVLFFVALAIYRVSIPVIVERLSS